MITGTLLNLIFITLTFLLGFLPSVIQNSAFATSVSNVSGYISSIYTIIPTLTISLLAIIAFDILFESSYFIYKVVYWIIRRFPTQS